MVFDIRLKMPGKDQGWEKRKPVIEHSEGPVIVQIGTDPSCDIRLPANVGELVRKRHCTLFYTGSSFRIDFEGSANVYVDGANKPSLTFCDPFHDGGSEIELRLGYPAQPADSTNPTIVIRRRDRDGAVKPPRKPRRTNDSIAVIGQVRERQNMLVWVVGGLAMFVAAAIGGGFFLAGWLSDVDARNRWTQGVAAALFPSVGVIGIAEPQGDAGGGMFEPLGTGWLCCDGSGAEPVIVTNYHVWRDATGKLASSGPQAQVVARFPSASNGAQVELALQGKAEAAPFDLHPLWSDFQDYLVASPQAPNVYDVVAIPLKQDQKNELSLGAARKPLALAGGSFAEVGSTIAVIGYPVENLPYALNATGVVPKLYTSEVVRKTSPFAGPVSTGVPSLLAVDAESAGGLSGSPIIEPFENGYRVVGLVSAASFADRNAAASVGGGRLASSSIVFGADSGVVDDVVKRKTYDDAGKLTFKAPDGLWDRARTSETRNPVEVGWATFRRDAQLAGCRPAVLNQDAGAEISLNRGAASDPRLDNRRPKGEHSLAIPFDGEMVWIAARSADPNGSLALDVRNSLQAQSTPLNSRWQSSGPGFALYTMIPQSAAGELQVTLTGDKNAKVKLFIVHADCKAPR